MGALLDKAIDAEPDYKIGTIRLPKLSANDVDMAVSRPGRASL